MSGERLLFYVHIYIRPFSRYLRKTTRSRLMMIYKLLNIKSLNFSNLYKHFCWQNNQEVFVSANVIVKFIKNKKNRCFFA